MPTYDYLCDACGHAFEEFQSITAKPLKKCPACGKSKLHRLIGVGAGVIFKGSGFYETDYRSESYKQAAKADKESASGGSGSASSDTPSATAEKKTDAKPDNNTRDDKKGPTKSDGPSGAGTPRSNSGTASPASAPAAPKKTSEKQNKAASKKSGGKDK